MECDGEHNGVFLVAKRTRKPKPKSPSPTLHSKPLPRHTNRPTTTRTYSKQYSRAGKARPPTVMVPLGCEAFGTRRPNPTNPPDPTGLAGRDDSAQAHDQSRGGNSPAKPHPSARRGEFAHRSRTTLAAMSKALFCSKQRAGSRRPRRPPLQHRTAARRSFLPRRGKRHVVLR